MKASALALAILLAAPGCSAEADVPARSEEAVADAIKIPPRPDGPVLDLAGILPPGEEALLANRLTDLWKRNGGALVVVSVQSLEGKPIEDFAQAVGNGWRIGDAQSERGMLLVVAPNERQVRIEVACGLQPTVTDAVAAGIVDDVILPKYRAGDLAGGTLAGADALMAQLALPRPANDTAAATQACGRKKEAA